MKKIISVILGCMCLLSTSNAMNTKYSSDNIAMQHTLLNVLQMMENVKDPALNNINNIGGTSINFVSNVFKLDDYKNSPTGNARRFFKDLTSCLVNCKYEDVNVNGLASNEQYKELKSIFNKILNIDYSNLSNAKNKMFDIFKQSKLIFYSICDTIKNESKKEYWFIKDDELDYHDLQLKLGRIFFNKLKNNSDWNNSEILLHKSSLLALYCEEIIMDLSLFPKDIHTIDNIVNCYWKVIFKTFEVNVSPYFK